MSLGNNNKQGQKKNNYPWQGKMLNVLNQVATFTGLSATEATLQLVLTEVQKGKDQEFKMVIDSSVPNPLVFAELRTWNQSAGAFDPPVYLKAGDNTLYAIGDPGGPVGPVTYINTGSILSAIYAELLDQGVTHDNSLVELQAINLNTDGIEALLTTIDADTSNLDVPLSTVATQTTLAALLNAFNAEDFALEATQTAIAADIATIEANIALLNSKFNTLGRKAEAVSTSVAIDNEAYAALLAIQTAVQNIDSDLGTGGLALETTQVAGNGILTTIDAVLDASKLVLDSIDADTAAMVVDLAAIEVLITTTNSLLTTIDAVIDQIQTNTLNTVNELTSANLTLASILADTTQIKNKTDLLNFIATALEVTVTSSVLPTGAATEATLASADARLATANLILTTIDAVLDAIKLDTANLDVASSTRASEATLLLVNSALASIYTNLQLNTISTAAIDTKLTPATRTHNYAVSNGVGSVPAGSMCGSVLNNGNSAGTWNGNALPAGVSIPWSAIGNRDTYGAIPFDATGTEFIIEYTT